MTNQRLGLDHQDQAKRSTFAARSRGRNPIAELPEALGILASRLREAVAERRASPPGSRRYRRADERIAYLNTLFLRLQGRMEVPAEIWLLGDHRVPSRVRRARPGPPG